MLRRSISAFTSTALGLGLFMSIFWWWTSAMPGFEAAANVFVLLAAIAGIPAERWATARERRNRALRAIRQELTRNREILDDERFRLSATSTSVRRLVYPRLVASAVETALISGAFAASTDRAVPQLLYDWRNAVEEFNRRLDLTEIHMFTVRTVDAEDLHRFRQALHGKDGYMEFICDRLAALESALETAERDGGQGV